jgi:hypothetical protein
MSDPHAPTHAKEVEHLLHEVDGHLGLAVHRGEGSSARWKAEAQQLIGRIRRVLAEPRCSFNDDDCPRCSKFAGYKVACSDAE